MLILPATIKLLESLIQRFLLWFHAPSSSRYGYRPLRYSDRNDHYYSPKKPEWLKAEIVRLKALMPQAGCRR